jgi:hypothetical protein
MGIDKQKSLENLENLRNEVDMSDDEYDIIKNVIDEEYGDEPNYYSQKYKTRQEGISPFFSLLKPLIIIVIIVSIIISFIWRKSSTIEKRNNHPFNYHSAPSLCIMKEKEFKSNLETADSITINNAIKELDGRKKYLDSLDKEALHIEFEKKQINDRLLLLKNKLSELGK